MTTKLKKKVKNIVIGATGSLLSIAAICAIGAKSFSLPFSEVSIDEINTSESVEVITGNPSATSMARSSAPTASDGAIICDSIVQAVREYDLLDGNYTFRVVRKSRKHG